uniref:Uncharacterized protein n=1 Tax=Timema poppense TaxID=170557 RepID=A0A7R9H1P3_TIMPO|nr:unnamed protein product [Timema poppensis]
MNLSYTSSCQEGRITSSEEMCAFEGVYQVTVPSRSFLKEKGLASSPPWSVPMSVPCGFQPGISLRHYIGLSKECGQATLCDEMLDKLEKERNFLISQKQLPVEQEAFASEEQSEIVEPYNEEQEAEWRVRHRQKEQEYRQRLAELRNKEKTPVNNEEDLWQRLDQLELEEELQEELDRLHSEDGYYSNDEQDYGEEVEEDEENPDETRHQLEEVRKRNGFVQKDLGHSSMAGTSTDDSAGPEYEPKRRRVSFADLHQEENDGSSEEDELRIVFRHTPIESTDLNSQGCEIPQSPADIYTQYRVRHSKDKETVPKSILKKSSEPIRVQQTASLDQVESLPTVSAAASKKVPRRVSPISVFGDVLEHSAGDLDTPQAPSLKRPTSKFRANRQAAKQ